jgi:hypothetical protein
MIAQPPSNSWSELLTSALQRKQMPDGRNGGTRCLCRNVSNPAQNRVLQPAIIIVTEQFPAKWEKDRRGSMKPVFRPLRRRLALIADLFGKMLATLTPQAREVRSQRMCRFCGLITSRYKTCCLECGKSLEPA